MPSIKKEFIDRVTERSRQEPGDLVSIISEFTDQPRKEGASYKAACPLCHSEHSLVITPGKRIFKCFNCNGLDGKYPLDYLMKGQRMTYPEAIEWLASYYNMVVEYDEPPRKKTQKSSGKSFCKKMLEASGLTNTDLMASVIEDENTKVKRCTFVSGTLAKDGTIDESGDDAVILYYDLDGRQVKYTVDDKSKSYERPYYRIRYQFPEKHLDKNKRAMKYRSPAGAPTFIYYPQYIRSRYQAKLEIPVLFIQEGEKKAEKACKHGIPSVAVSGIQNIGYRGTLPEDIIRLVDICKVKTVVFMLDADCYDLTHTLTVDDPIDRRPRNFFYAVRNFKDYFAKLRNHNIYVELYYGHIRKDRTEDKGTDDILTNTLKGKEDELLKDIRHAMNEKSGEGEWVQVHKITSLPDSKIQEFWKLQSAQDFCMRYFDQLKNLPEFTFNRRKLRFNENGELESAQPLEPDEVFWLTSINRQGEIQYNFCYVGAKYFLEHRGFFRYKKPSGEYDFIQVENNIVKVVRPYEVGDFIRSFTKDCLQKPILEMLYKGGAQYLGPNSLTMLDFFMGAFDRPARDVQRLYFGSKMWEITADAIRELDYTQLHLNIWTDMKKEFNAEKLSSLIDVRQTDGQYSYEITPVGRQCDFLMFLQNASNFTWRKDEVTPEEQTDNAQHLISKLAAFGYLVVSAKDEAVAKAVVGMDGKQSEVGVSNGRSGKSLLGEAVKQVTCSKYYNGKAFAASANNRHVWDGVTEKTKVVVIDDCQRDFDFEQLFGLITGEWPVDPKNEKPFTLPFSISPKIYITTNHAIGGDGGSFEARQWCLAFSDFYSAEHEPKDDFKTRFFSEWDFEQWNLFWNLVAQCVQIYFRFGYVPAPGSRLKERKLIQDIGEDFIMWADEYFSAPEHFNTSLVKKTVYADFVSDIGPAKAKFYTTTRFKAKVIKYCELRGFIFNPQFYDPVTKKCLRFDKDNRPDPNNDKRNSLEYITVGDNSFYANTPTLWPDDVMDERIDTRDERDEDIPE